MQLWHPGSLVARLPVRARDEIVGLGNPRTYQPGSSLVRRGEQGTHVMLLLIGRVKVVATSHDGQLVLLGTRMPGDLIGELACLDEEPRSATVIADVATGVRVIAQQDLWAFLERHPRAAVALSASVVAKLRWATRRRIDFVVPSMIRLARALHDLCGLYGRQTKDGIVIESLSQLDLAGLVGASEASAQKAFRKLREDMVISTGHRRITILDMTALARFGRLTAQDG